MTFVYGVTLTGTTGLKKHLHNKQLQTQLLVVLKIVLFICHGKKFPTFRGWVEPVTLTPLSTGWIGLLIVYLALEPVSDVARFTDAFSASFLVNTVSIDVTSAVLAVLTLVYVCSHKHDPRISVAIQDLPRGMASAEFGGGGPSGVQGQSP